MPSLSRPRDIGDALQFIEFVHLGRHPLSDFFPPGVELGIAVMGDPFRLLGRNGSGSL